jgi:hypothetical protein
MDRVSGKTEWTFGTHRARLDSPDVLVATFDGPTTVADVGLLLPLYREVFETHGPVYLVADVARSSMDAEARRQLGEGIEPGWFKGVSYVGASLIVRTISKALSVMVLFDAKKPYEVAFAATHDEARAQIEKWRGQERKVG